MNKYILIGMILAMVALINDSCPNANYVFLIPICLVTIMIFKCEQ